MQKTSCLEQILQENAYPGRGIVAGKSACGRYAVCAYFIMGRSENSRNRVFVAENNDITIYPYDSRKVGDPSLIIYSPIRSISNVLIVTNGDQTDTIYNVIGNGGCFEDALKTRTFEPDAPNYTPRISAILDFNDRFSYKISIIKRETTGLAAHEFYDYEPERGIGHFIHTYKEDGQPLPSFSGEPRKIEISGGIKDFSAKIWNALNAENKVSLCVKFINLLNGEVKTKVFNKNDGEIQ